MIGNKGVDLKKKTVSHRFFIVAYQLAICANYDQYYYLLYRYALFLCAKLSLKDWGWTSPRVHALITVELQR